jgi:hypothetical protein
VIRDFYQRHRSSIALGIAAFAFLLSVAYIVIPSLTAVLAVAGGWALAAGAWSIGHWETVERNGGRLLGVLGRASTSAERVALSAEMQGVINGGRKALSDEFSEIMPYPARVKFVRGEEELGQLKDGEIVLALRDPSHHSENTARAALAYVVTATIRPARPYVDLEVLAGVHYSLTKRMLRNGDRNALDFFLTEMWAPALKDNSRLQDLCHEIEAIEGRGLLTRVLLVEFLELGRRLYGQYPPPTVHKETADFVDHLARLAQKGPDEDVELLFSRGSLRVGVVLVAEREKAVRDGPHPYVSRCLKNIRAGCDAIYLLARGARCDLVSEIVSQLGTNGRVLAIDLTNYEVELGGQSVSAVVARVSVDQRGYAHAGHLDVSDRYLETGSAAGAASA